MLPRLGGVGPNVWRHGLVVIRSYLPLLLLLGLGTMAVAMGLGRMGRETHGGLILAGMLIAAPVFLTPSVLCDFRGDVDRLDVLKALPLRPIFLAVGEILAPSLVVVAVQAVAAGILQAILGRIEPGLIAVPLLALPVNFLLFAIENLLFLLFPIRMVASGPGDFQTTGRHMLMFFGKFLCLAPVAFVALLAGWLVYWLTASLVAGVGVAWIILLVSGIALLPLVVLAFDRFDVARDTPV
jgi:hypothetical protein